MGRSRGQPDSLRSAIQPRNSDAHAALLPVKSVAGQGATAALQPSDSAEDAICTQHLPQAIRSPGVVHLVAQDSKTIQETKRCAQQDACRAARSTLPCGSAARHTPGHTPAWRGHAPPRALPPRLPRLLRAPPPCMRSRQHERRGALACISIIKCTTSTSCRLNGRLLPVAIRVTCQLMPGLHTPCAKQGQLLVGGEPGDEAFLWQAAVSSRTTTMSAEAACA